MKIGATQEARVFGVKEAENRKNTMWATISTYEGKAQDEKAKYASWNASFVGDAYTKAKILTEKSKIILTNAKIDNFYDKEKERLYVNVIVFDFETEAEDKE